MASANWRVLPVTLLNTIEYFISFTLFHKYNECLDAAASRQGTFCYNGHSDEYL